MAAPSTGHPVRITLGTVWSIQVDPPAPRPQTMAVTCMRIVFTLARVVFGVVYFKDCPQQPNIPVYLLGLALIILLITFFERNESRRPRGPPGLIRSCLELLLCLFTFAWFLAGDWWVFSVYQPNYDPTAADGRYCNKTLYTFAFWTAVYETLVVLVILGKFCRGLLFFVQFSPAQANQDFHGRRGSESDYLNIL